MRIFTKFSSILHRTWLNIDFCFFFFLLKTGSDPNFNRTHVTLKNDNDNVQDAILVIEHTELTDRNWYNCTARNRATGFEFKPGHKYEEDKEGTYVRVKGKFFMIPTNLTPNYITL